MSVKTQVGTYHEKRGDDVYTVYKSSNGDVVQIEHYDAMAAYSKYQSIHFWSAEAPALIKLIEKAAGIKPEKVEYEYAAMRIRNHDRARLAWPELVWVDDKEDVEELVEVMNNAGRAGYSHSYIVAKRVKAGPVEDA